MPLEWFKCPDQQTIAVQDCLKKCRLPERCETLPYLNLAAEEREWTGTPSTTQLLNGTMMSFLKITKPYAIDPDDMAFAIHGTLSHGQLEAKAIELGMAAELSTTFDGRNVADLIEKDNGDLILTDYKTWGSFKVAKAMGLVQVGKQADPSGETYKRSGAWGKAGSPKLVPVFQCVPSEADNFEAELQLNRYRIMLLDLGIKITKMRISAIVRDGGTSIAQSRGITRNTYLIPVNFLDDDYVTAYFEGKTNELLGALDKGECDHPCDSRECWTNDSGRPTRCLEYCEVWYHCPKGLIERGGR